MLRHATRPRTVVLLDFLAPALVSKAYASSSLSSRKGRPKTVPGPDSTVFERLKKQINLIHDPSRNPSSPQTDIYNSTVVRIQQAVKHRNFHAVLDYWRYLEQRRLLHFLGPVQLEMISELMASSFIPALCSDEPWDPNMWKLIEDIALRAAVNRATRALEACMVTHLRRNDPEAVIVLYERFKKGMGDDEIWSDPRKEHEESALAVDQTSSDGAIPFLPGRVAILLAVITAHAIQDSFPAALKTCLATVVRFHSYTTEDFLKHLRHDPPLQKKVESYVQCLNTARIVARPPSLSKQITNLAEGQRVKHLERLYQAVLDGLSGPDPYLAADPSKVTPIRLVAMTEVGWTSFLVAFLKCRRRDLAAKIWDDMSRFGLRPGVSMWTALLDAYDSIGAVDEAVTGWQMMRSQGVKPDGLTYRALISALFNGHKADDAMHIFHKFQTELMPSCSFEQILSVHNTVLHGLLYANRVETATSLLTTMEGNGPAPDIVSFNTFLAHYGRRGDFKALAVIVNKMTLANLVGDVFSFSTILSALLKAGRSDAPEMMLGLMRKQGVQPNVATFSAIIDQQMRQQDEKSLLAVMRMLQQMEQDPMIHPNDVTYTSILAGLYRDSWLPAERAEDLRVDIVGRMKARDIKLNLATYHTLIRACMDYDRPEGLQNALGYYHDMRRRKMPFVHTTWYILLAGLIQRGEWGHADELVRDMHVSGFKPVGSVLQLVSRIRKRRVTPGGPR